MLRLVAALVAAIGLAGCSGSGDDREQAPAVSGPLCAALPAGDDPGAPATLADEPADVALTWIPVVTTFEAAAVRPTPCAARPNALQASPPRPDAP